MINLYDSNDDDDDYDDDDDDNDDDFDDDDDGNIIRLISPIITYIVKTVFMTSIGGIDPQSP